MSHVFPRHTKSQPPVAVGGEGCYLIDRAGKRYLDGSGGAAVSCLGHGNREVIDAIKAQLDRIGAPRDAWDAIASSGGAARDAVLGVRIVDGRGEVGRFGGEVMKNVAGYDIARLQAGAFHAARHLLRQPRHAAGAAVIKDQHIGVEGRVAHGVTSSRTVSGGRPITARSPFTSTGRSSSLG